MTDPGRPGDEAGAKEAVPDELGEVALPLREVDPKKVAADLSKQIKALKESLQKIEETKTVRRETLDSEVSL